MKLNDLFQIKCPTLSFEVFPPKKDTEYGSVQEAVTQIARLKPDFMSVTYGAGGGTSDYTAQLAGSVRREGVTALAHLTCVSSTRGQVRKQLELLRQQGVENILALRGDIPSGMTLTADRPYHYSSQLIRDIREFGGFSIGAACYPEGHVECASQSEDLLHLKEKADEGCDFLVTQMFFDNSTLYSFLYRAQRQGIQIPVVAGVMPVTSAGQIARICQLSGTTLPQRFRMIVDKFGSQPAAMKQAGIAYATEQIVDLIANGIRGVHVYTMNKPDVAGQIAANLSEILGR